MTYTFKYSIGFITSLRPKRINWGKKKLFEIIINGERFHYNDNVAWCGAGNARNVLRHALRGCWNPHVRGSLREEFIKDIIDKIGTPNYPIIIQEVKE